MVQKILDLRVARAEINTRRNVAKLALRECTPDTQHQSTLLLSLDTVKAELKIADRNLERHEAMLGRVGGIGLDALKKIKGNRFFEMRMNVCALKRRLRDKLRARKFEEGRLRADYRPFTTGKCMVTFAIPVPYDSDFQIKGYKARSPMPQSAAVGYSRAWQIRSTS